MSRSVSRTDPIWRLTLARSRPGSERISSVEPPPISAISSRKSALKLSERLTEARQFGLLAPGNDFEIDVGLFLHALNEIRTVTCIAQRAGGGRDGFFCAGRTRRFGEFRDRIERQARGFLVELAGAIDAFAESGYPRTLEDCFGDAVALGFYHQHQNRVGADVESCELHATIRRRLRFARSTQAARLN